MGFDPKQGITLTYEQLQDLMRTFGESASKLNPLEQRKLDDEMARERRKAMMMVELGKAEEQARLQKQNGCSHMRDFRTGDSVASGAANGEWTTGGQAYQNGTAAIICTRCSKVALFRPSPDYYNIIIQNGLLKQPFPPDEQTLCIGCFEPKKQCKCNEIAKAQREARPLAASA